MENFISHKNWKSQHAELGEHVGRTTLSFFKLEASRISPPLTIFHIVSTITFLDRYQYQSVSSIPPTPCSSTDIGQLTATHKEPFPSYFIFIGFNPIRSYHRFNIPRPRDLSPSLPIHIRKTNTHPPAISSRPLRSNDLAISNLRACSDERDDRWKSKISSARSSFPRWK